MAQLSTAVEAYQKKGRFKVEDRDSLQTIDEICSVFGTEAVHRGFLRIGATPLPLNNELHVWYPNADNDKGWVNQLSADGATFTEYHADSDKRIEHIAACIEDNKVRVTFFKSKDKFQDNQYHFIGVFVLDIEATQKQEQCVWHKISNEYFL